MGLIESLLFKSFNLVIPWISFQRSVAHLNLFQKSLFLVQLFLYIFKSSGVVIKFLLNNSKPVNLLVKLVDL